MQLQPAFKELITALAQTGLPLNMSSPSRLQPGRNRRQAFQHSLIFSADLSDLGPRLKWHTGMLCSLMRQWTVLCTWSEALFLNSLLTQERTATRAP